MLLQVFWGSLIVGGLLIAASILLGGNHSEMDVDGHLDLDADGDMGMVDGLEKDFDIDSDIEAWLPFLSLRFWTFGLATFGAIGTLVDIAARLGMGAPPDSVTLSASIIMGVGAGWLTAWGFRKLKRESVSGDIGMHQIKGTEATILLTVRSSKRGKIRALVDGQTVDLLATSLDNAPLKRGERVLVVDLHDGTAVVTRMHQLSTSKN